MKSTYIILVLVLVIMGIFVFTGKNNKLEAPTTIDNVNEVESGTEVSPVSSAMPAPGAKGVEEMIVEGVKEFTVTGKNFSFSPNLITVKKGDRVRITFNNTEGFHDFVIDEFGAATKQAKSPSTEVIEFTADKVGSFEYYCSVGAHRAQGMKGVLKVE